MDERTKELIAIGVSLGTHCQPCLAYHLGKARELGANEEDIQAAIEVGYMVEKGASTAMKKYVNEILKQDKTQSTTCCSDSNSKCCG